MSNVEYLKRIGAISDSYNLVDMNTLEMTTLTEFESTGFVEENGVVVVDNPEWVILDSSGSKGVYVSFNGSIYGKWNTKTQTFFEQKLIKNSLNATRRLINKQHKNIIKTREVSQMARDEDKKNGMTEGTVDTTAATQETGNDDEAVLKELAEMQTFGTEGAPAGEEKPKAAKKELTPEQIAEQKLIAEVKEKSQLVQIANTKAAVDNNRSHGRMNAFITKTDAVVKVVKKTRFAQTADNKYILDDSKATQEEIKAFNATDRTKRTLPKDKFKTETTLGLAHAKPGAIVGGYLTIPEASHFQASLLSQNGPIVVDTANKNMLHFVVDKPSYEAIISIEFGNMIYENGAIYGEKAALLEQTAKIKTVTKDNVKSQVQVLSLNPQKSSRKGLLTRNNYIPLKTFKTGSLQKITAETSTLLNHNVEAALKKAEDYNKLSEDTKKVIKDNAGVYFADWFKVGNTSPVAITYFDNKQDSVTAPMVALRYDNTKETSKSRVLSFDYNELTDTAAGPLSLPHVRNILDKTNMTAEDMVKRLTKLQNTFRRSKKKATAQLSADELVKVNVQNLVANAFDLDKLSETLLLVNN